MLTVPALACANGCLSTYSLARARVSGWQAGILGGATLGRGDLGGAPRADQGRRAHASDARKSQTLLTSWIKGVPRRAGPAPRAAASRPRAAPVDAPAGTPQRGGARVLRDHPHDARRGRSTGAHPRGRLYHGVTCPSPVVRRTRRSRRPPVPSAAAAPSVPAGDHSMAEVAAADARAPSLTAAATRPWALP